MNKSDTKAHLQSFNELGRRNRRPGGREAMIRLFKSCGTYCILGLTYIWPSLHDPSELVHTYKAHYNHLILFKAASFFFCCHLIEVRVFRYGLYMRPVNATFLAEKENFWKKWIRPPS
ncbi:hypothetical protein T10_6633 [Trichinella papuae]|uniref:Uncharacterized protein n=1 Tax=Trichinella papuae TaxID=268474 RepID=A0A0V1N2K8_9BILA|nr:hypothetical protein T10_6633 [Trichinella papuae]